MAINIRMKMIPIMWQWIIGYCSLLAVPNYKSDVVHDVRICLFTPIFKLSCFEPVTNSRINIYLYQFVFIISFSFFLSVHHDPCIEMWICRNKCC